MSTSITCTTFAHEALKYHGHSDCLNAHQSEGPYHWIIYTWPCRACGGEFAWMLAAERKVFDARFGDWEWSGATAKSPVFPVPQLEA
jgi:hypothetical protein